MLRSLQELTVIRAASGKQEALRMTHGKKALKWIMICSNYREDLQAKTGTARSVDLDQLKH